MARKEASLTILLSFGIVVSIFLSQVAGANLPTWKDAAATATLVYITLALEENSQWAWEAIPSSTSPPTHTPTFTPTSAPSIPIPTPTPEMSSISSAILEGRIWPKEKRFIIVDQEMQLMHVYENGVKIRTIPCSTGFPSRDSFTPAWVGRVGDFQGTFFSFGTYADDAWFLFRSSGDILIHGLPYVYEGGEKVYREMEALGRYPASHGCIRIHPDDARWLTEWNPKGTLIIITPWRKNFPEARATEVPSTPPRTLD